MEKETEVIYRVVITAEPYDKDLLKIEVSIEGEGDSEPTIAKKHLGDLIKEGNKINEFFGDGSLIKMNYLIFVINN